MIIIDLLIELISFLVNKKHYKRNMLFAIKLTVITMLVVILVLLIVLVILFIIKLW